MRYTTWADVVAKYPKAATAAAAEAAIIENTFIGGVEGEIDAALAVRYAVPIANTPSMTPFIIQDIAKDLAYYKIAWLQLEDDKAERLDKYIQRRLMGLACGSLTLTLSGSLIEPASSGMWGTHQAYPNVSGVDNVRDWDVSSGELLDKAAERGLTC